MGYCWAFTCKNGFRCLLLWSAGERSIVAFALLMLLMIVLAIKLPRYHQKTNKLLPAHWFYWPVIFGTPVLAVRASLGALSFANFGLLWTAMAFY